MIGRLLGWFLIALATLALSGEAVMALGTGAYDGIAAGEVWTLLSGQPVDGSSRPLVERLLDLPAWMVIGAAGVFLVVTFRRRQKRRMFAGHRRAALH